MLVLGIETSCDETAASVVENGKTILSNVIASQVDLHAPFGGVFPELASRKHIDLLIPVIEEAIDKAKIKKEGIDLIAVTQGPGLMGPLLIGVSTAKGLSYAWKKPFVGVNHVEAHLYAAMMTEERVLLPALGIVISGGHTFLSLIRELGHYELIGTTVDDAIGEAFDKVASLLDLPYPGGPMIEKLAQTGNPNRFAFKSGVVKGRPLDFSFSGLKTSVLYAIKGPNANKKNPSIIQEEQKADIAASFQAVALEDICQKSLKAAQLHGCKAIYVGGGVSNNRQLRSLFEQKRAGLPIFWPPPRLSLDNAAMIAGLGYHVYQRKGQSNLLDLHPLPRIPLSPLPHSGLCKEASV